MKNINHERVAIAALQSFFNITGHWKISVKQQRTLLGEPLESTFNKWKKLKSAKKLDSNTLERISYILGIHKALRILLPTEKAAFEWINKPNIDPVFKGQTALSRILTGRVADLHEVRKYLDQQFY